MVVKCNYLISEEEMKGNMRRKGVRLDKKKLRVSKGEVKGNSNRIQIEVKKRWGWGSR